MAWLEGTLVGWFVGWGLFVSAYTLTQSTSIICPAPSKELTSIPCTPPQLPPTARFIMRWNFWSKGHTSTESSLRYSKYTWLSTANWMRSSSQLISKMCHSSLLLEMLLPFWVPIMPLFASVWTVPKNLSASCPTASITSISPDFGQPPYVLYSGSIQSAGQVPIALQLARLARNWILPYLNEWRPRVTILAEV